MLVEGTSRRQREPTWGLPCARQWRHLGVTVADQGQSRLGRAGARPCTDDRGRCRPHRKGTEDSGRCLVGDARLRPVPHAAAGLARRRRRRSRHLQSSLGRSPKLLQHQRVFRKPVGNPGNIGISHCNVWILCAYVRTRHSINGADLLRTRGNMAQHLTDAVIRRLSIPAKGNKLTYDDEVAGFGCRVTAGGSRSYVLNYPGRLTPRERRHTIGEATHWRCTAARVEAKRLKLLIDRGGDPQGDLQAERAAPIMLDLCQRFEAEHLPRVRPSTRGYYQQAIRKYVLPILGPHTKVADVAFADIDALHRKITARHPYAANRTVALLSKV